MITDFLISLSLANLCFIRIWKALLFAEECELYTRVVAPTRKQIFLTLLSLIALTAIYLLLLLLIRYTSLNSKDEMRSLVLSLGSAVAAMQLFVSFPRKIKHIWQDFRRKVARMPSSLLRWLVLTSLTISIPCLIILYVIVVPSLLILFSPLALLTNGVALFYVVKPRIKFTKRLPAEKILHTHENKVIWLLLDEFDMRLGFESRPEGIKLPNLDKFLESSLYATQALPPCHCTEISIPALITGQMVKETTVSANECILNLESTNKNIPLTSCKTVFETAHKNGFNSAVSGWYHPYERLIGHQLDTCRSYEPANQENSLPKQGIAYIFGLLRSLIETPRYSPFGQSLSVKQWIKTWDYILRDSIEFSTRKDLDLIYLHWTIPHAPYIYDTKTKTCSLKNSPIKGYFGNLELADKGFGMLLHSLDEIGELENTSFVISSDHWWREAGQYDGRIDQRVPFIVKLPGMNKQYKYTKKFNTVLSSNLVLDLLDRKISDVDTLVSWLDMNGKDIPPTKGFS